MPEIGRRGGRPRRKPGGAFDEATQLAVLMRQEIDASDLTVEKVHALIQRRPDGYSLATLYRRLAGKGLEEDQHVLTEVVLEFCTPAERREVVRKRVDVLVDALRAKLVSARPEKREKIQTDAGQDIADELATAKAQIERLQQELLALQRERLQAMQQQVQTFAAGALTSANGAGELAGVVAELREDVVQLRQAIESASPKRDNRQAAGDTPTRDTRPAESGEPVPSLSTPVSAVRSTARVSQDDPELETVVRAWQQMDPDGSRTARALRRAMDSMLDGARTGRYQWAHLSKVEKTAFASFVEREVRYEFDLADGEELSFKIGDVELDLRYSATQLWTIPPETVGLLTLLVNMDDSSGRWSLGIIRPRAELLNVGANRDGKRTFNRDGKSAVRYLQHDALLPANALLNLPEQDRHAIFALSSSQQRVEELFRRAHGVVINHTAVQTVARQADWAKRVRDARHRLAAEGYAILSGRTDDPAAISVLGFPPLRRDEFMSLRLVRRRPGDSHVPGLRIDGDSWVVAQPGDSVQALPRGYKQVTAEP